MVSSVVSSSSSVTASSSSSTTQPDPDSPAARQAAREADAFEAAALQILDRSLSQPSTSNNEHVHHHHHHHHGPESTHHYHPQPIPTIASPTAPPSIEHPVPRHPYDIPNWYYGAAQPVHEPLPLPEQVAAPDQAPPAHSPRYWGDDESDTPAEPGSGIRQPTHYHPPMFNYAHPMPYCPHHVQRSFGHRLPPTPPDNHATIQVIHRGAARPTMRVDLSAPMASDRSHIELSIRVRVFKSVCVFRYLTTNARREKCYGRLESVHYKRKLCLFNKPILIY